MINLILKLMENEALKTAFLKLANMSISASWLVLAILVLRLVLKKVPKWPAPANWLRYSYWQTLGTMFLMLHFPSASESG